MTTPKKISMAALMAILAAAGYSGYTVVKENDLAKVSDVGNVPLYKVERVIDGDTFELEDKEVVRLLGIDTPEEGECYFKESTDGLRKLVEGKDVELRMDVTATDDFGRLLRYAILPSASPTGGNVLINESMVEKGLAVTRSDPRDKLYSSLLIEKREEASRTKRGLWGACDYEPGEHSQKNVLPENAKCVIKGNMSEMEFGKTYFVPECNNYGQVKIDPSRGEKYFCSESDAKKAGFVKAQYCP